MTTPPVLNQESGYSVGTKPRIIPDPAAPGKGRKRTAQVCKTEGCGKRVKSRGLCVDCYGAWYNAGGKNEVDSYSKSTDPLEKLWENTAVNPETGCWEWQRGLVTGYGKVWHQGKWYVAHRMGYELLVGPIPKNLVLDHLCGNQTGGCWNPDHLEPVTQRINTLRGKGSIAMGFLRLSHPDCVCWDRYAESCPDHGQLHWRDNWRDLMALFTSSKSPGQED